MCRLHLLTAIPANNQFYYSLDILGTPSYNLIYTLRSLLKGTYTYRSLLLTFLLKSPVIINRRYILFISLYKRKWFILASSYLIFIIYILTCYFLLY